MNQQQIYRFDHKNCHKLDEGEAFRIAIEEV